MRSLGSAFSLVILLGVLTGPGWAQAPYACGPAGCPPGSCGPGGCGNGSCGPQYPRYPGYGVSSSNYYQAPPPHMLGGPAYGFSFPYPYAAYCAPKTYIAPATPSYYYYPFPYGGQSHSSYYAGSPQYSGYYGSPVNQGSVFATERSRPAAPAPVSTKTAGKKVDGTAKTAAQPAADPAKKPSFLRKLLFWQNS